MLYDKPNWKANWEQTKKHYKQWWKHEGPVLLISGLPYLEEPRDRALPPEKPGNPRDMHTEPDFFARNQRSLLSSRTFPADNLPIAHTDYGCVQLAACLGAEPEFDYETVWYNDCITDPDEYPPLSLKKTELWWKVYRRIMQRVLDLSQGDFLVGMPAFGSNLDVLAELRGTQNLLYDLSDRPGWVIQKLVEINEAFFTAFDDYYEYIQLSDGSSAYAFFHIWGPGKVSQVQCDFAAMISPSMFKRFVVPALQSQCDWLDHSLFHLDGPSCICHLDYLLEIVELDAVQWTPGAGQPGAGDAKWYDLYARILNAGKSVQIIGTSTDEAKRILNTFGCSGVYLLVTVNTKAEADDILATVDSVR